MASPTVYLLTNASDLDAVFSGITLKNTLPSDLRGTANNNIFGALITVFHVYLLSTYIRPTVGVLRKAQYLIKITKSELTEERQNKKDKERE